MTELQKLSLFYSPKYAESIISQIVREATIIGIKQEVIQRKLKSSLNFTENLFTQIINRQNMDNYDQADNKFDETVEQEPIVKQLRQKLFSKIIRQHIEVSKFQKVDTSNMKRINSAKLSQQENNKSNIKKKITTLQKKSHHSLPKISSKQLKFYRIGTEQLYENNQDELKTIQNELRSIKIQNQSIKKLKLTFRRPMTKHQEKEQFSFSNTINPIKYSLSEPKKIKKHKNNFNTINIKAQRGLKIYNFQKSQKYKQRQEEKRCFFQNYHQNYQGSIKQQEKIIRQNGLKLKQQEEFCKNYCNSQDQHKRKTIKQQSRRRSSSDIKSLSTTNSNSLKKILPSKRLSRADPKMKIQLPNLKKPQKKLKLSTSTFHQSKYNIQKNENCHIKLQNQAGYNFLLDKKQNNQKQNQKDKTNKVRISLMSKQMLQNISLVQNLNKYKYFSKFVPISE